MFRLPAALAIAMVSVAAATMPLTPSTPLPTAADPQPVVCAPSSQWIAPVTPLRVTRDFAPPAQRWHAGHRGVDVAATPEQRVVAPVDGRVVYAGTIAGRGVVSIEHRATPAGPAWRSSVEPVDALVRLGNTVCGGQVVATVSAPSADRSAGHCAAGCLHWGVRRDGEYVDPVRMLTPSVRLLPLHVPSG